MNRTVVNITRALQGRRTLFSSHAHSRLSMQRQQQSYSGPRRRRRIPSIKEGFSSPSPIHSRTASFIHDSAVPATLARASRHVHHTSLISPSSIRPQPNVVYLDNPIHSHRSALFTRLRQNALLLVPSPKRKAVIRLPPGPDRGEMASYADSDLWEATSTSMRPRLDG